MGGEMGKEHVLTFSRSVVDMRVTRACSEYASMGGMFCGLE